MTKKEQQAERIIARGKGSNHSHVIVGDAKVTRNEKGEILIEIGKAGAILKHLLETEWLQGNEKWTGEHHDINLVDLPGQVRHGDVLLEKVADRIYKYVPQVEFDPYSEKIQQVRD